MEVVNPGDKSWARHRYLLTFGVIGPKVLLVWANSLEDALDEAVDWLAEHAPGLLCDEEVREAYQNALARGLSEEDAQTEATMDTTQAGNEGHYLHSWEWTLVEDPSRSQIKNCA